MHWPLSSHAVEISINRSLKNSTNKGTKADKMKDMILVYKTEYPKDMILESKMDCPKDTILVCKTDTILS